MCTKGQTLFFRQHLSPFIEHWGSKSAYISTTQHISPKRIFFLLGRAILSLGTTQAYTQWVGQVLPILPRLAKEIANITWYCLSRKTASWVLSFSSVVSLSWMLLILMRRSWAENSWLYMITSESFTSLPLGSFWSTRNYATSWRTIFRRVWRRWGEWSPDREVYRQRVIV